jgi:hypothetical protein
VGFMSVFFVPILKASFSSFDDINKSLLRSLCRKPYL